MQKSSCEESEVAGVVRYGRCGITYEPAALDNIRRYFSRVAHCWKVEYHAMLPSGPNHCGDNCSAESFQRTLRRKNPWIPLDPYCKEV